MSDEKQKIEGWAERTKAAFRTTVSWGVPNTDGSTHWPDGTNPLTEEILSELDMTPEKFQKMESWNDPERLTFLGKLVEKMAQKLGAPPSFIEGFKQFFEPSQFFEIMGPVIQSFRASEKAKASFTFPSEGIMFTLLAIFAGRPDRIPRHIFEKTHEERTAEEKEEVRKYIESVVRNDTDIQYLSNGGSKEETKKYAIICNNPRVEADALISDTLFQDDSEYREENLAIYIKKTFGPEGLRHLLGILIGMDENGRSGTFTFDINDHLERLGMRREPSGSFKTESKKKAFRILEILSELEITTKKKVDPKKGDYNIQKKRLFHVEETEEKGNIYTGQFSRKTTIGASRFWYKSAFEAEKGQSPQYTKLLKKIACVNHWEHPLTIYLAPFFAIFWRMSTKENRERGLSVKNLMEWCDLDYKSTKQRTKNIQDLECELDYMKQHGFLGSWEVKGKQDRPSQNEDPLKCILTLLPPEWLKDELDKIASKKPTALQAPSKNGETRKDGLITREKFLDIFKKEKLTQSEFAHRLGMVRQGINYIIKGTNEKRKNPSLEVSLRVRKTFPEYFNSEP